MKLYVIIIFFMATHCCTVHAQTKSMDTFSTNPDMEKALSVSIFKALQHKSITEWIALYPSNDEYKSILEKALAGRAEGLTQAKIDQMMVRRKNEAAAKYDSLFKTYQMQGDSIGINWKEAAFMNADCTIVSPENTDLIYLMGDIYFYCGHNQYLIEGLQAVEIKGGYKIQSLKGFRQVMHGE